MPDFLKWASLEPQSVVWLPVLHRFISAQNSQHNVRCICCKQDGFNGFRYRSLKRFNHDLCHQCFLYGRASEAKLVQYPLVEYYNQTGKGENMRDMVRFIWWFHTFMNNSSSVLFVTKCRLKRKSGQCLATSRSTQLTTTLAHITIQSM